MPTQGQTQDLTKQLDVTVDKDQYERAKRKALALLDAGLSMGGTPLTREEAHARRPQ